MNVRMRFRTDGLYIADMKAQGKPKDDFYEQAAWDRTPPAEPGDVWRVHWYAEDADGNSIDGPFAGYGICCLLCKRVHPWTTALNCLPKPCPHEGKSSCWTWTGSAEDGTLIANPSLHAVKEHGGCGFHGWLRNGILEG